MGGTRFTYKVTRGFIAITLAVVICTAIGLVDVLPTSGVTSTSDDYFVIAGEQTSSTSPSPDGTPAVATSLNAPNDVVVDGSGNSVISDTADNEVEVLATSSSNPGYVLTGGASWQPGDLYVIAGSGSSSSVPSKAGSSALSTDLNSPEGITVDPEGNIAIADSGSDLVAVIAVSSNNPGYEVTSWSRGNIYAIAGNTNTYPAPSPVGSASLTIGLNDPCGVAIDANGNVLIADTRASEIDVLAVSGEQSGYQIGSTSPWTTGDVYEIAGGGSTSPSYTGVSADSVALRSPEGVSVGPGGNVAFADDQNDEIDLLAVSSSNPGFSSTSPWATGDIYQIAGTGSNAPTVDGVKAELAALNTPAGVAFDAEGDVVIANSYANQVDVLAEASNNPGYALGATTEWQVGNVYSIVGGGGIVPSPSANSANAVALNDPEGVSVSPLGSVTVADSHDSEVEQLNLSPASPTLETATASLNSAAISWDAPSENGGESVTGYEVLTFNGATTPISDIAEPANASSADVGGLASGGEYEFEVEATNAIGTSSPSNELAIKTEEPAITPTPTPNSSLAPIPNPTVRPTNSSVHLRERLMLRRAVETSTAGLVTLTARCLVHSCEGTVVLKGTSQGRLAGGPRNSVVRTFIAGSSHYSITGARVRRILVPLSRFTQNAINSKQLIKIRAVVSVDHGRTKSIPVFSGPGS